jgi:hypothetical protein
MRKCFVTNARERRERREDNARSDQIWIRRRSLGEVSERGRDPASRPCELETRCGFTDAVVHNELSGMNKAQLRFGFGGTLFHQAEEHVLTTRQFWKAADSICDM